MPVVLIAPFPFHLDFSCLLPLSQFCCSWQQSRVFIWSPKLLFWISLFLIQVKLTRSEIYCSTIFPLYEGIRAQQECTICGEEWAKRKDCFIFLIRNKNHKADISNLSFSFCKRTYIKRSYIYREDKEILVLSCEEWSISQLTTEYIMPARTSIHSLNNSTRVWCERISLKGSSPLKVEIKRHLKQLSLLFIHFWDNTMLCSEEH